MLIVCFLDCYEALISFDCMCCVWLASAFSCECSSEIYPPTISLSFSSSSHYAFIVAGYDKEFGAGSEHGFEFIPRSSSSSAMGSY